MRIPGCYTFVRHLGKMGPSSSLLFLTVDGRWGWGGKDRGKGGRMGEEKTKWKKSSLPTEAKADLKKRSANVAVSSKQRSEFRSKHFGLERQQRGKKTGTKDKRQKNGGTERSWGLLYSACGCRYDMLNRDRERTNGRTLGCKGATNQKLEAAEAR